ncbi:MAG TPA: undecaprenyl-diphosphatase UppP [Acidimicrobiia bacterium]|nr:undecaprenyl-diphosphatase UppP [Acidimicrobiia bacterium]
MLQAIVLGIVQGLTEFLPVSSSGHLVVVPAMLGWDDASLTFDLVLHLGTLVAVVAAYRSDLLDLARGLFGRGPDPETARRLVLLLAIGTVPAALAGALFASTFEDTFDDALWTCAQLVVTGGILVGAEALERRWRSRDVSVGLTPANAAAIGVAQAAAILPGISRSGATIATGLAFGIERAVVARFSFLMSIPIIAGAILTKVPDVTSGEFELTASVAAGFVAAAVSGWLAIEVFLRYLRSHSLRPFAIYLFVFAPVAALIIEVR